MKNRGSNRVKTVVLIILSIAVLPVAGISEQIDSSANSAIVVSATPFARAMTKTPGSIGVLVEDDIKSSAGVSITDMMEQVPGVNAVSDSAWGSDVSIRGLGRNSVVMLIDGVRVNTATDIGARFGLVGPSEIERVEVLKGPISSLYGSGSVGGVVNVFTKGTGITGLSEWEGRFSARYIDNSDGWSSSGAASYSTPQGYCYVSQGYRNHSSYEDGDGNKINNSQFEDYRAKTCFGRKLGDDWSTDINLQYFEGKAIGIPGSGVAPLPPAADVTYPQTTRSMASMVNHYEPSAGAWKQVDWSLYWQFIERRVRIDNFPSASPLKLVNTGADHETYGSKLYGILEQKDHTLVVGADAWQRAITMSARERTAKTGAVTEDQPLPEPDYFSAGLFFEEDWFMREDLVLDAGARVDQIHVENKANTNWEKRDENDESWNIHVGAAWEVTPGLDMKLVFASGYRAASLEERYQYLQLGGGVTKWGDPALGSERSRFIEYSIQWGGQNLFLNLAVFYNRLNDLIGEQVVDDSTIVNANVDKAEIYGGEAEARWDAGHGLELYGGGAKTRGRDLNSREYLPYVAPLDVFAGIRKYFDAERIMTAIECVYVAEQDEVPMDVDVAPDWFRMDVVIDWDMAFGETAQRVMLRVNNVLNETYRDYLATSRGAYFNEPGRSVSFGYSIAF